MAEFTKKGHRLAHLEGLVFECTTQKAVLWEESEGQKGHFSTAPAPFILSRLALFVPCNQGQIVATLRAWLSVYDDEELLAQVAEVVGQVVDKLPVATPAAGSPQGKQGLN